MIRAIGLFAFFAARLAAEVIAAPPTTFCGDQPVFCFGKPGECRGLVDNGGEALNRFSPPLEIVGPISEGLLAVGDPRSGLTGYLDPRGNWALEPQWELAFPFKNGRARFCEGDRCGFLDRAGRVVIEPRFSRLQQQVRDFDEDGYARFYTGRRRDDPNRRVGVMDANGEVVLEPTFLALTEFSGGVAAAVLEGPCWQEARDESDLYRVFDVLGGDRNLYQERLEEGERSRTPHCRWRLIDVTGRPVSDRTFLEVGPFSDGLAAARTDDRDGYIDRSGEWVAPPTDGERARAETTAFEGAFRRIPFGFHDGLARVWVVENESDYSGRYYFVKRSGELAFEESFHQATDFCHGVAHVTRRLRGAATDEALIDTSGKEIFSWPWR